MIHSASKQLKIECIILYTLFRSLSLSCFSKQSQARIFTIIPEKYQEYKKENNVLETEGINDQPGDQYCDGGDKLSAVGNAINKKHQSNKNNAVGHFLLSSRLFLVASFLAGSNVCPALVEERPYY